MRSSPSTREMSSDGQKNPSSPTKKCGDPTTPRWQHRLGDALGRGLDAGRGSDLEEYAVIGDVEAVFEQCVAQGEADPLARPKAVAVGGRGQDEAGEGTVWEPARIEAREQVRGDLKAEGIDLLADHGRVERRVVHQLQRPGSDAQTNIGPTQDGATIDEASEPDMGERAADIGEHLDGGHGG
jgi:hypothetical protein